MLIISVPNLPQISYSFPILGTDQEGWEVQGVEAPTPPNLDEALASRDVNDALVLLNHQPVGFKDAAAKVSTDSSRVRRPKKKLSVKNDIQFLSTHHHAFCHFHP